MKSSPTSASTSRSRRATCSIPDVLQAAVLPFADNRRTVESLGEFPRLASLTQFLLHLACRKVDTYGYCIVIAVGETLRNGLSQLGYSDHYFGFILYSSQMIRDEERLKLSLALLLTPISFLYKNLML